MRSSRARHLHLFVTAPVIAALGVAAVACDSPGTGQGSYFVADPCTNGAMDPDESGVDCGGACQPCPETQYCDNGALDEGESDVDCGGDCEPCAAMLACRDDGDCHSGNCNDGVCGAPPSCDNGVRDGAESDVDCGGSCAACATTRFCNDDGDCLSHVCTNGVCRDPSCDDRRINQDETGVDCGGVCAPCEDGGSCLDDADCADGICDGGFCCQPNACGECAALPAEVCDGGDNDCDGATDEASQIGAPPSCPLTRGVCQGARATCRGAEGWTCAAAEYGVGGAAYEAESESSCDGLDNDCDGATDEGLVNACGECGAAPAELCDGVDNDCDGQTDEGMINACGECGTAPVELCDGVDNDCDGQTDEIAPCAGCGPPPATIVLGTTEQHAWNGNPLVPQSLAVMPDQRVVALVQDLAPGSFSLVTLDADPAPVFHTGTGFAYAVAPLDDDVLVVVQSGELDVVRVRLDGSVARTWRGVIGGDASLLRPSIATAGSLAVLSVSRYEGSTVNPYSVWESRLAGDTWGLRDIAPASSASVVTLAGGRPVHVYARRREDPGSAVDDMWSVGDDTQAAALVLSESGPPAGVMTAPDGRVFAMSSAPLRVAIRSAAGAWSESSLEGPHFALGLGLLPGGELISVAEAGDMIVMYALEDEGPRLVGRHQIEAGLELAGATFAVDAHARVHLLVATRTPNTISAVVMCPSPWL